MTSATRFSAWPGRMQMAMSITAQAKAAARRWYALRLDNPVLAHCHIMETDEGTPAHPNELQAWRGQNEIAVRNNWMVRCRSTPELTILTASDMPLHRPRTEGVPIAVRFGRAD